MIASAARVVYVTGGRQRTRRNLDEWHAYECALVVRVDLDSGACTTVAEYQSPPDACPDVLPSHVFKCGSVCGDVLTVCTQTEVLSYRLPDFDVVRYVSDPLFNDLHHVLSFDDGRLLVANTGRDTVIEITPENELGRIWSVVDGRTAEGSRPAGRDFRKVPTTKPHRAHPNHLFILDGDVWVTRFVQRDAVCLTRRAVIKIPGAAPHDGLVEGDSIYFTTVDGCLIEVDRRRLAARRVLELDEGAAHRDTLGWCRGLVVCPDSAWVGLSRIRPTGLRRNLEWIDRSFGHRRSLPTRLASYDIETGRALDEIELEGCGLNAVFSILPERQHSACA